MFFGAPKNKRPGRNTATKLQFQELEKRQLLASAVLDGGTLVVEGTNQDDKITISRLNQDEVRVKIKGELTEDFEMDAVTAIVVNGRNGDDEIVVEISDPDHNEASERQERKRLIEKMHQKNGASEPWVWGGDRSEIPIGVVLIGGNGDDYLSGSMANDILIGGNGQDTLDGQRGRDILIGGTTDFDNNIDAVVSIMEIWKDTHNANYYTQISQIQDGSHALEAGVTVHDDGVSDALRGYNEFGADTSNDDNDDGVMGDLHSDWYVVTRPEGSGHGVMSRNQVIKVDRILDLENMTGKQGNLLTEDLPGDTRAIPEHIEHNLGMGEGVKAFNRAINAPYGMALVTNDQATHVALRSGDWSDTRVWGNQGVPSDDARVVIPSGMTVVVDGEIEARIKTVRVDAGATLGFATDQDTLLKVDTIVSMGSLEIGTESNPVEGDVTARILLTDDGEIDRDWDPMELSRGILVMGTGSLSMVGHQKTAFLALAKPVYAGDTQLQLKSIPQNWQVGDSLVIANTDASKFDRDDRVTITAIDGDVVYFDRPATFNHVSPRTDLEVHVANTTRNIVVESEYTGINDGGSLDAEGVKRRGHTMMMSSDVVVKHSAFVNLGRTDKSTIRNTSVIDHETGDLIEGTGTNQEARYSLHFHRTGVDASSSPIIVDGVVVDGNPGWGITQHSSHANISNTVAYNVRGSAFNAEVGDEIGSWTNNLALRSASADSGNESNFAFYGNISDRMKADDLGFAGHGFWLAMGSGVTMQGNIASGSEGAAFQIPTTPLHERGIGQQMILLESMGLSADELPDSVPVYTNWDFEGNEYVSPFDVPFLNFSSNTSYGSETGLNYTNRFGGEGWMSEIHDFTAWNVQTGVVSALARNISFDGLTIINSELQSGSTGISVPQNRSAASHNLEIRNFEIDNFFKGIELYSVGGRLTIEDGMVDATQGFFHDNTLPTHPRKRSNALWGFGEEKLDFPLNMRVTDVEFSDRWQASEDGYKAHIRNDLQIPAIGRSMANVFTDVQLFWEGQQLFYEMQRGNIKPLDHVSDSSRGEPRPDDPRWNKSNHQLDNDPDLSPTGGEVSPSASKLTSLEGFVGVQGVGDEWDELVSRVDAEKKFSPVSRDHHILADVGERVVVDILGAVEDKDNSNVSLVEVKDSLDSDRATVLGDDRVEFDTSDRGFYRFEVVVADSDGNTYDVLVRVEVGMEGTSVVAQNDSIRVEQGAETFVNLVGNDIGNGLDVVAFDQPDGGTVTMSRSGRLVYIPDASFLGSDQFTYQVSDGYQVDTATVHVQVVEASPVVWQYWTLSDLQHQTTLSKLKRGQSVIDLHGNQWSVVDGKLNFGSSDDSNPKLDDNSIVRVRPLAEESTGLSQVRMEYELIDGDTDSVLTLTAIHDGERVVLGVWDTNSLDESGSLVVEADLEGDVILEISIMGGTAEAYLASLTIVGTDDGSSEPDDNRPPVVQDDNFDVEGSAPVGLDVLANDHDPDGDSITVVDVSQPENGTVQIQSDGTVLFQANDGFVGDDSFTYDVSDGEFTRTATVSVAVTSEGEQSDSWLDVDFDDFEIPTHKNRLRAGESVNDGNGNRWSVGKGKVRHLANAPNPHLHMKRGTNLRIDPPAGEDRGMGEVEIGLVPGQDLRGTLTLTAIRDGEEFVIGTWDLGDLNGQSTLRVDANLLGDVSLEISLSSNASAVNFDSFKIGEFE